MDLSQEKQQSYFGLKVNMDTLKEKEWTITEVADALGISKLEHVIGYDHQLAEQQKPHYHIHWTDTRSLDALQKAKQKAMPQWGRTTKLYAAKDLHGDVYCWYGYAVKEQEIFKSETIQQVLLDQHAHTQAVIKRSRLNYAKDQASKKDEKRTLEEQIFDAVKIIPTEPSFYRIAIEICKQYLILTGEPIRKSSLEHMTIKFLLKNLIWTSEDVINHYFKNI